MQSKNISGGQNQEWRIREMKTEDRYYNDQKRSEVMETARRLRRKYLRYQQAEIVYSLSHKKLMELASDAEAIYSFLAGDSFSQKNVCEKGGKNAADKI